MYLLPTSKDSGKEISRQQSWISILLTLSSFAPRLASFLASLLPFSRVPSFQFPLLFSIVPCIRSISHPPLFSFHPFLRSPNFLYPTLHLLLPFQLPLLSLSILFFSSLHSSNFLFSMLHLSLPFQLPLLSLHPFPRRFSSSLHSPNFSSSTLHLSFLFQLPVLFLHPFSFFPVFVEFLVPYTSPFILDAFFFSLHPSNFSPTLLIFHSCPNYHCSLFLRRFFSFKFFIIPSFSLSFYPLSSRSSSFPLFFLPPLSVHLDAFFLPSPNPLRYAATTYFSFSR